MVNNNKTKKMKPQQNVAKEDGHNTKVTAQDQQQQQMMAQKNTNKEQHEQQPLLKTKKQQQLLQQKNEVAPLKIQTMKNSMGNKNKNKTKNHQQQQKNQQLQNNGSNNSKQRFSVNSNSNTNHNNNKKTNNSVAKSQNNNTNITSHNKQAKTQTPKPLQQEKTAKNTSYRNLSDTYAQTLGNSKQQQQHQQPQELYPNFTNNKPLILSYNDNNPVPGEKSKTKKTDLVTLNSLQSAVNNEDYKVNGQTTKLTAADLLTAALIKPCAKCLKPTSAINSTDSKGSGCLAPQASYIALQSLTPNSYEGNNSSNGNKNPKQYRKSKSYVASSRHLASGDFLTGSSSSYKPQTRQKYQRSQSDRRSSFDRQFAERNKNFVPIEAPARPILASSNIHAVIADTEKLVILERLGKGRSTYPIMQVQKNKSKTTTGK